MKISAVIASILFSVLAYSQHVDQWRGNDRSGIYHETGLLEEWPAGGPPLLWHYEGIGKGFSSAIVHSDKIYVTGMVDSVGFIHCIDTQGKLVWKNEYGKEWNVNFPGARSTPAYDNGRLYLMSSPAVAVCIEAADGSLVWKKDLVESFGARQLRFGMAESPLIVDGKVIFTPGGTRGTLVALDKNTGEDRWVTNVNSEKSAYCSPLFIDHHGNKMIVTSLEKHIVGVNAENGKLLWSHPYFNERYTHPNTPVYDGENIYSFNGYGKGGIKIRLSADGSSVTPEWENITLDPQMGGIVLIDGNIYGSGHRNIQWQCVDAKTGTVKYETFDVMNGAVIYNDGLLYCYSDKTGMLSILKPGEDAFEIKGSFRIEFGTEQHWAHPVLCNGVLYIRHGNSLLAYSLKK